MLNIPLLRKMVDYVTIDLKNSNDDLVDYSSSMDYWDQHDWFMPYDESESRVIITETGVRGAENMQPCGSFACLAGHTALQAAPVGTVIEYGGDMVLPDGRRDTVPDFAARALGLTHYQQLVLFSGANSAERLQELAAEFIAKAEGR